MGTRLARVHEAPVIVRSLTELIPLIKEQLELANNAAEPYWFEAGKLLKQAQGQISRGEFFPWCERNFGIGERQCQRYMKATKITTRNIEKRRGSSPLPDVSLNSIVPSDGSRTRDWHAPVKAIVGKVDFEALRQDELNRAGEKELRQQLAMRLIDIGFKVLAAELHPDKKGGSKEAMARLNEVRKRLQQYI